MKTVSVADAWSLAPIGEVRLGARVVPVPPLTFGRFQRLLGSEPEKIAAALAGDGAALARTRAERAMDAALRWSIIRAPRLTKYLWRIVDQFGLGLRHVRVPDAARWVAICVPGVTENEWRARGTQRLVAHLFLMFCRAHEWAMIADAIRFGEPQEEGEVLPSRTHIVSGLLAMAKATGYTVEALNEMRVDGFYLLTETLRSQQPESADIVADPAFQFQPPGESTPLLDLLKKADEARAAQEPTDG